MHSFVLKISKIIIIMFSSLSEAQRDESFRRGTGKNIRFSPAPLLFSLSANIPISISEPHKPIFLF